MKEQRVPCPQCGELILPEAKKCRFCGEKISSKSLSLPLALYVFWFFSMTVFLVALFFVRRAPITSSGFWLATLGLITLVGSIAFLLLLIKTIRSLKNKRVRLLGLATVLTFFAFFAVLFNLDNIEAKLGFTPPKIEQTTFSPTLAVSPNPTSKPIQQNTIPVQKGTSNKITCTGPDGKTFQTTQAECDNFNKAWGNVPPPDPNEIIRCNIHPNCGGGYREMTRSSCDQMVCCTVDLNNNTKLISKDQCNKEQEQNLSKANSEACNRMCNFSTEICYSLHEPGMRRTDCVTDINSKRTDCLVSCTKGQ